MRSIETYLEAIPQLILQIYIMLTTGQAPVVTVLACFGSVGGLSMAMRSFGVSMNGADDKDISPAETICFLLYQACTLLSRVLAFALLLNLNVWAGIGLLLLHWILATLFFYITVDGVDDGCTGILTRIIFGFIFIFNVPIGFLYDIAPLRWIEIAYFAENSLIAGVWLKITDSNYYFSIPAFYIAIAIVVSIPALFILSFFFVLCLHLMDKRHKKLNQG